MSDSEKTEPGILRAQAAALRDRVGHRIPDILEACADELSRLSARVAELEGREQLRLGNAEAAKHFTAEKYPVHPKIAAACLAAFTSPEAVERGASSLIQAGYIGGMVSSEIPDNAKRAALLCLQAAAQVGVDEQ